MWIRTQNLTTVLNSKDIITLNIEEERGTNFIVAHTKSASDIILGKYPVSDICNHVFEVLLSGLDNDGYTTMPS